MTLSVERVPIESLTPHSKNARQGDVGALAESLQSHGQYKPLVVQREGRVILAGNHTMLAAKALGWSEIDVVWADVDDDEGLRILLQDNRASDLATYDQSALAALLTDMAQQTEAGLAGTGFDGDALDQLLSDLASPALGSAFDPGPSGRPPVPETQDGDLWALGQHRLLCGDSLEPSVVAQALDGRKIDVVFTDPPYGVNVTGKGGRAIAGDISFTAIPLMFETLPDVLGTGAWVYVCGGQSNMPLYSRLFERYFRQLPRVVIWDKGRTAVLRHNGYHSCYEMIYWTFLEGGGNRWFAPRDSDHADDIWRIPLDSNSEREHVTQKPVALAFRAIGNSCPPGGLVFDPFAGVGCTLLGAEAADRASVSIEIDPGYCDVICRRFQSLTGVKPTRDGEPHDFLAEN